MGARSALGTSELVTDYETALAQAQPGAGRRDVTPDDVAFILYTSGTTGRAKGVMHTHRGLLYQAADTNLVTEANRSDVMLATTPFFTAGGMVRTVSWLYLGQTMVIHQRFDPQAVIDEIERSAITFTTFIPTMLHRTLAILEDGPPRDMSSLRRISYGSAPVPPGLARKAMDLLGCDLQQRYGLTECGGQATILTPQDHRDIVAGKTSIATSCGQETPMCAIRVIDVDGDRRRHPATSARSSSPAPPTRLATGTGPNRPRRRSGLTGCAAVTWATLTRRATSTSPVVKPI